MIVCECVVCVCVCVAPYYTVCCSVNMYIDPRFNPRGCREANAHPPTPHTPQSSSQAYNNLPIIKFYYIYTVYVQYSPSFNIHWFCTLKNIHVYLHVGKTLQPLDVHIHTELNIEHVHYIHCIYTYIHVHVHVHCFASVLCTYFSCTATCYMLHAIYPKHLKFS